MILEFSKDNDLRLIEELFIYSNFMYRFFPNLSCVDQGLRKEVYCLPPVKHETISLDFEGRLNMGNLRKIIEENKKPVTVILRRYNWDLIDIFPLLSSIKGNPYARWLPI